MKRDEFMALENYEQVYDGEPFIQPLGKRWKLACCHCGLVHEVKIELADEKNVKLTVRQNAAATKRLRKLVPQKYVPVKKKGGDAR